MKRALLPWALLLVACGGSAKTGDPNVVAVGKPAGSSPGASTSPPCDSRGALIDAEHAEGLRIVERCITGATPETKAAVEKVLALRADKALGADALRADLEAAYATGLVEQIEATARKEGAGCTLFLAITERPKISALTFEGLVALKDDPKVAAFPKAGTALSAAAIHASSERLREAYASGGWDEAKVSHVIEPDGPGKARVKIVVTEGARTKVGKITFEGVRGGRETGLRKAMELDEGGPLDPERLMQSVFRIAAFYYDRGFMNVKVEQPKRTRAADGTTAISVTITEGPVFRIGKLSVRGVEPPMQKEILAALEVKSGEIFNRSKVSRDLAHLESRSREKGRPMSAEPETKLDAKAGIVDLTFAVKER